MNCSGWPCCVFIQAWCGLLAQSQSRCAPASGAVPRKAPTFPLTAPSGLTECAQGCTSSKPSAKVLPPPISNVLTSVTPCIRVFAIRTPTPVLRRRPLRISKSRRRWNPTTMSESKDIARTTCEQTTAESGQNVSSEREQRESQACSVGECMAPRAPEIHLWDGMEGGRQC